MPESRDGCKVDRVAEKYELTQLDAELQARRESDNESLRSLAEYVNTRILEAAMQRTDADITGDPESVYQALTGDEASPERKAAVRDQLEFSGIDVDAVLDAFVSHELVRKHLRECLDVDTSRSGVDSIAEARQLITAIQEREHTIVERTLERLQRKGLIDGGDIDVIHTTRVTCVDCGQSYALEEFLDRGGCNCSNETTAE